MTACFDHHATVMNTADGISVVCIAAKAARGNAKSKRDARQDHLGVRSPVRFKAVDRVENRTVIRPLTHTVSSRPGTGSALTCLAQMGSGS